MAHLPAPASHPAQHLAHRLAGGEIPAGLYRLQGRTAPTFPTDLATALAVHGWRLFVIHGTLVVDKATFLHHAAAAFHVPAYFGHNWDAFEEMVNDLGWIPAAGYVLFYDEVYRFAADQEAWQTAQAILQGAAAAWAQQGVPFVALLRRSWWYNRHLPTVQIPDR